MAPQKRDGTPPSSPGIALPDLGPRSLTRRTLMRALGLGSGAAIVGAASGSIRREASAQETPAPSPPTPVKREPGGPSLEQLVWDLELDPERIFRFVADEVAYEAYSGALRGAKGTLWGLTGNSVDQALLLAELLTQAGVPVRFAAGELAEEAERTLLDSMRLDAAAARSQLERLSAGGQVELASHPELTAEQRAALESPDELRERLMERARTQLADGLETLEAALADEGIELPEPALELPERERRQHVWVQYADGPRWFDLDPSIPQAEPGTAYARQEDTWAALPEEIYHRVRFRAVIEKNSGGVPVREDSFDLEIHAADLVGVPVVFAHLDPSAYKDLGISIGGLIEGTLQYIPTLLAGTVGQSGTALTVGTGSGALDVFGTSESDGEAIGEWLEIEITTPDAEPRSIVREVFDRVGIARRAAGEIDLDSLPPFELTEVPELGQTYLPLETVTVLGVVGGPVPASYFAQDYSVKDIEADVAVAVHGYHAARDRLQIDVAADRGYRWYHDGPNVTAAVLSTVELEDGQFGLSTSLDLIHQSYAFVPLAGETPSVSPQVLAGVLAHVAERIGIETGAELAPEAPRPGSSVGAVFEAAARERLEILTLTPENADLASLAISDDAKARIAEALAAGYVVVVPERAVELDGKEQVGWWQVDPSSGRTFDLMENGRGQDLGETTVIIVGGPAWRAALAWKILSFIIGFIVGVSAYMAFATYPN